jgi:hypothetical protein
VSVAHGDYRLTTCSPACPPTARRSPPSAWCFSPGQTGTWVSAKADLQGNFHLGNVNFSVSPFPAENVDLNASLPISRLSASSTSPATTAPNVLESDPLTGWAPANGSTTPQHLTLTLADPLNPHPHPYLTAELVFNRGGNASPAKFQLQALSGHDDGSPHPPDITGLLLAPRPAPSGLNTARLRDYFHSVAPEKALVRHQIRNLEERIAVLTENTRCW